MKEDYSFLHVGITVSDLDRTIEFYEKYFDFKLTRRAVFSEEFIARFPQLYHMEEGVYSDFALMSSPDGIVLELFRFSSTKPAKPVEWNVPGYHHICIKVDEIDKTYRKMAADGVEFFFEPHIKGDPKDNKHWVFLKDPDGNMIELQD
jgi:lactoylglutathione lyase